LSVLAQPLRLTPPPAPIGKRCNACGVDKPKEDFNVRSAAKDGRDGRCKLCTRAAGREGYRRRTGGG
jgi:hypothetical protein